MSMKKFFNGFSFFYFFSSGLFFSANQLLMTHVCSAQGFTAGQQGAIISAFHIGSLLMVLFFGEFAEHFGKRTAAAFTSLAITAGCVLVCIARGTGLAFAAYFLYGAGTSAYESTMFSLCADNNRGGSNRILNFTQGLFSTGAVLGPIIIAAVLTDVQYKAAYAVIGAFTFAQAVYFMLERRITQIETPYEGTHGIQVFRLAKNPAILFYMAAIAISIGAETAITYWTTAFFEYGGFPTAAPWALSLYWCTGIFSRFAASRLKRADKLVAPCFMGAAVAMLGMLWLPGAALKLVCTGLAGVLFGPLYAGLSSLAGDRYPQNTAAAYCLMIFSVNAGGLAFQPIISSFAAGCGIGWAYIFGASMCAAVGGAYLLLRGRLAAQ